MSTSHPSPGERILEVRVDDDTVSADLVDGRTIPVPLAWYPRLLHATAKQRANWQGIDDDRWREGRRPQIDRNGVLRWIRSEHPERWSEATCMQFARKLLSAASEAGSSNRRARAARRSRACRRPEGV